jgi:hypothetical protein
VAGPPHTLTFPASIDGYQQVDGPSGTDDQPSFGQALCDVPALYSDYQNSQGSFVTLEDGHHASQWSTFNDFWGVFFAAGGEPEVPVPAGPLGGQAACTTDSMGTICTWFDDDTFGELDGGSGMSPGQCASVMLAFRNAVEHLG